MCLPDNMPCVVTPVIDGSTDSVRQVGDLLYFICSLTLIKKTTTCKHPKAGHTRHYRQTYTNEVELILIWVLYIIDGNWPAYL